MKRFALLLLLAGCVVPLASAQSLDHVEAGVFANYFRISQFDIYVTVIFDSYNGQGDRTGFFVPNLAGCGKSALQYNGVRGGIV